MHYPATTPDPARVRLSRSTFEWSPLDEVIEALTVASTLGYPIFVERSGDRWRWSFSCGSPYPALRIAAVFLKMDYNHLVAGARAITRNLSVVGVPSEPPPAAWALLDLLGGPTGRRSSPLARPTRRSRRWRTRDLDR